MEKSYFYSDSLNDLPLLEVVTHPIATNPDPRLRAEAEKGNGLFWNCLHDYEVNPAYFSPQSTIQGYAIACCWRTQAH
jgi:hypothetical protein